MRSYKERSCALTKSAETLSVRAFFPFSYQGCRGAGGAPLACLMGEGYGTWCSRGDHLAIQTERLSRSTGEECLRSHAVRKE